ncbi:hypothetical protein VaNZ11_001939 [Volvox africanus]|uniref:Uncharacterized protein n=1 Tax=Volvox africanus TaxID=51714 RepID=A0ABQ5RQU2_9CHLO|nr:hypothetical protein VaNZ11_001939 [Volvox africanus]
MRCERFCSAMLNRVGVWRASWLCPGLVGRNTIFVSMYAYTQRGSDLRVHCTSLRSWDARDVEVEMEVGATHRDMQSDGGLWRVALANMMPIPPEIPGAVRVLVPYMEVHMCPASLRTHVERTTVLFPFVVLPGRAGRPGHRKGLIQSPSNAGQVS